MKFGRTIKNHASQDAWAPYYLDYKGLKKIINSLAQGRTEDAALLAQGIRPAPRLPQELQLLPESNESVLMQTHRAAFFFKLEREIDKINDFYLQKEAELKVRLRSLIDKRKVLQTTSAGKLTRDSSAYAALSEGFRYFEKDLSKLQNFVEINATAARKILKKWDKRSKSNTKELYLARQVDVQPCFNREIITELSDAATANILKLDALVDSAGGLLDVSEVADGITDDHDAARAFSRHVTNVDMLEELERDLGKAVEAGDRAAAAELLARLPADNEEAPATRVRVSRILWRAVIDAPPKQEPSVDELIPISRLDFSFVDDINGRSCLHEAAGEGRLDLVSLCLERGVPVNQADDYGRQALHYAALNGHDAVCGRLLELGANALALDLEGCSSAVLAVTAGQTACVRVFLAHGVPFEALPDAPIDPLALACQHGHADIALLLLQRGAQIGLGDSGFFPQHLAAREGHADVLRLLVEAGASIEAVDKWSGWTPLFHAASEGHVACVRILLDAKCQQEAVDEFGKSSLHYAAWQGHIDCVNLLLASGSTSTQAIMALPVTEARSSEGLEPVDPDGDVDLIPLLSLPPPIIPFRIYGHNYLDHKALVQVSLGHPNSTNGSIYPAVRLYGQTQLSSLKLVMTPRPDLMAIPHSVILPLADEREVFAFQVSSFDAFTLDFDLFPTFGSRAVGKAVALPSLFSQLQNQGAYVLPLVDRHLKAIGEIAFELSVVRAFEGAKLDLGGGVETYWKATANPAAAAGTTNQSQPPAPSAIDIPALMSSAADAAAIAGPTLVTASSLTGQYVRIVVQVTRDGVPVAYALWKLPVEHLDVHVGDVTLDHFQALAARTGRRLDGAAAQQHCGDDPTLWYAAISKSLMPLQELLEILPATIGVNLDVRYPTLSDIQRLNLQHTLEVNAVVDAVLTTVYASTQTESPSGMTKNRRIVFSSFNPVVCTALNWKQPNYAVFFGSYCGLSRSSPGDKLLPANRVEVDRRCTAIREAVKFAKANNLLGVIFDATLLLHVPTLIASIKAHSLVLTASGNDSGDAIAHGADALLANGVLTYSSKRPELDHPPDPTAAEGAMI